MMSPIKALTMKDYENVSDALYNEKGMDAAP